ncbi:hypothetical protein TNCV_4696391 [Trichonephila clavipes]|nr:hypothetical protein TNCV_4696391 [Trichonephila clavipes]
MASDRTRKIAALSLSCRIKVFWKPLTDLKKRSPLKESLDSDGCVGESKESIAREDDISDTTLEAASSIMEMDEPVDCFHPAMEPEFLPTIYQPVLPSQKDKPSTTFRFIGR